MLLAGQNTTKRCTTANEREDFKYNDERSLVHVGNLSNVLETRFRTVSVSETQEITVLTPLFLIPSHTLSAPLHTHLTTATLTLTPHYCHTHTHTSLLPHPHSHLTTATPTLTPHYCHTHTHTSLHTPTPLHSTPHPNYTHTT